MYSLAEIELLDNTRIEMMVNASPSVLSSLAKEMHNTGFLVLWNDTDTLCVQAVQIRKFIMRQITKEKN